MMNVRGSLRASTVVVALALAPGAMAQAPTASPPSTVDTRIGQLKYEGGFPTKETVEKLYNEMDFQRAVMAYQYAEPLVALNEVNVGIKKIGISEGDMAVVQRFLDPNGVALTGNNTTIYGWSFLDLAKGGPLVVETPEGAYGAFFDLWQRPVAEIGPEGADKGKGGKFLVLPSDYAGTVPAGYFPLKISTTLGFLFVRGIVKNGDVEAAAKPIEETRIYPLAKHDNPTKTKAVLATGKKWYSTSPEGFEYWERVADIVNRIPADQDGAFLLSLLKPLGIEQGKPFNPDARQKQILTDASRVGWAMDQTISMAPRSDDAIIYPGQHWEWVLLLNPGLQEQFWRELELRTNYYFQATLAAPAMKNKVVGSGSQYLRSARDNEGNWLDGGKNYRLRVPASPPAKEFWSVTVYDYETRSMVQTDTDIPAKSSVDKLIANADGSIDLYFGPTAPAGKESNWVKTLPNRGWWVWFRLYGPLEPFFNKTWQLADFEKVN